MLFLDYTPELSEIDFSIYTYIVAHSEHVVHMRIRDLAKEIPTSTTTILRFCKKFECDGFSEFKIRFDIYQKNQQALSFSSEERVHSLNHFLHYAEDTESKLNQKMKTAAEFIADRDIVLFVGEDFSYFVAEYGVRLFSSITDLAVRVTETANYSSNFFTGHLREKTVVIVFSETEENGKTVSIVNQFLEKKIPVVSITPEEKGALAHLATINLAYYFSKKEGPSSQVPAIFIIEQLAERVRNYRRLINRK